MSVNTPVLLIWDVLVQDPEVDVGAQPETSRERIVNPNFAYLSLTLQTSYRMWSYRAGFYDTALSTHSQYT
jgi:hypothetical protein